MEELASLLVPYRAFITYTALRSEVPLESVWQAPENAAVYPILPRACLDPRTEALNAMSLAGALPTAVLLPGKRFDAYGTRHGQGGGWYDRFLSRTPSSWLRVGLCFSDQFSRTPLSREAWDQPVHVVCVIDRATGTLTLHHSDRLSL